MGAIKTSTLKNLCMINNYEIGQGLGIKFLLSNLHITKTQEYISGDGNLLL